MNPNPSAISPDQLFENDELVNRAKAGDQAAFGKLFELYNKKLYNFLFRMTGEKDAALDLVSEAFYLAWRALPKLKEPAAFTGWLYRIATNIARSRLRKKKLFQFFGLERHTGTDEETTEWEIPDDVEAEADILAEIDTQSLRKEIFAALETLSPSERTAFVLRHAEEKSTAETAKIMGIAEGTVKSLLYRAKEKLAKKLSKNEFVLGNIEE